MISAFSPLMNTVWLVTCNLTCILNNYNLGNTYFQGSVMLISLHAFHVTYAERDIVLLITYVNLYLGIGLLFSLCPSFPW
jgi:hypothetical protein